MPDLGVLARDTITLLNYEEANADGSRALSFQLIMRKSVF